MIPALRLLSWRHLRFALYVALSASSGVAWAGLFVLIAGDGRNHDMPIAMVLLMGTASGLVVGLLMRRFYRAEDWRYTIYWSPLALWLGVYFFFLSSGLLNFPGHFEVILGAAIYATYIFLSPFLFLTLFAMINGLLLRVVLCCGTDERSD